MATIDEERIEARRKAQERLAAIKVQNANALQEYAKLKQAETAKTARLRALRLAKEAADRETSTRDAGAQEAAAIAVPPPKPAVRTRSPRATKKPTSSTAHRGQGET